MEAMQNPDDPGRTMTTPGFHVTLALVSLAAAGIHFAAIRSHLDVGPLHGLFFIVVAWAQALWGVAILVAPRRVLLITGLAVNVAVLAVWVLSRTVGVPAPPQPWMPEPAGVADSVATILELVIVAGCAVALRRSPSTAGERMEGVGPLAAAAALLVVVASTAIAADGGHAHASGGHAADDHEGADGHVSMVAVGDVNDEQIAMIDASMARYANVDVAFDAGWETEHDDWPEVGSHFYRDTDWTGSFPARPGIDIFDPEFLMYSKLRTGEEWELVAVAYVADMAIYQNPPPEISGAAYHTHVWTCLVDGEELEEDEYGPISELECDVRGGVWDPGGVWMTHVWFIDNPLGRFAESNPALVAERP
jgi:hypothetical protein